MTKFTLPRHRRRRNLGSRCIDTAYRELRVVTSGAIDDRGLSRLVLLRYGENRRMADAEPRNDETATAGVDARIVESAASRANSTPKRAPLDSRDAHGRARTARGAHSPARRRAPNPHSILGAHPATSATPPASSCARSSRRHASGVCVRRWPCSGIGARSGGTLVALWRVRCGRDTAARLSPSLLRIPTAPCGIAAIRTAFCQPSATSICICSTKARTASSGRSSARTSARSTACSGVSFAVWAPNARRVSVVGDFCSWDGRVLSHAHARELRCVGAVRARHRGRCAVQVRDPHARRTIRIKTDPFAAKMEQIPGTASIVQAEDDVRVERRCVDASARVPTTSRAPVSIYEVHLGSWARVPEDGNRPLTYARSRRDSPNT